MSVTRRAALSLAAVGLFGLLLSSCGAKPEASATKELTVAATAVPHAEILEFIKPKLAAEGITLKVKVFNDYVQPNLQVDQKQIDANFFQTKPYMDAFNAERGTKLVIIKGVHVEPFGAYSKRYKALAELPTGAVVALPNDPTNTGRALILLHKSGLITLKDPTNVGATTRDVVGNPKQLTFRELESPTLPRVLDQVDLALINTNYALDAGLDPNKDALVKEGKDSPYTNYLVARADNQNDPRLQTLARIMTTPEVAKFINDTYHGAVLPAF